MEMDFSQYDFNASFIVLMMLLLDVDFRTYLKDVMNFLRSDLSAMF